MRGEGRGEGQIVGPGESSTRERSFIRDDDSRAVSPRAIGKSVKTLQADTLHRRIACDIIPPLPPPWLFIIVLPSEPFPLGCDQSRRISARKKGNSIHDSRHETPLISAIVPFFSVSSLSLCLFVSSLSLSTSFLVSPSLFLFSPLVTLCEHDGERSQTSRLSLSNTSVGPETSRRK